MRSVLHKSWSVGLIAVLVCGELSTFIFYLQVRIPGPQGGTLALDAFGGRMLLSWAAAPEARGGVLLTSNPRACKIYRARPRDDLIPVRPGHLWFQELAPWVWSGPTPWDRLVCIRDRSVLWFGAQRFSRVGSNEASVVSVYLPLWFMCALVTSIMVPRIRRDWKRVCWSRTGRCATCGYDLREHSGRCPECGAIVAVDG